MLRSGLYVELFACERGFLNVSLPQQYYHSLERAKCAQAALSRPTLSCGADHRTGRLKITTVWTLKRAFRAQTSL